MARHFRDLWSRAGVPAELEQLVKQLAAQDGWPDGWIAIRTTIRQDVEHMPVEYASRLRLLEMEVRPRDLIQKVRAYVLSRVHSYLDVVTSEPAQDGELALEAAERLNHIVEELGREAAVAPDMLARLVPELLRSGLGQQRSFGRGLALGAHDIATLWQELRSELACLPAGNLSLMMGFIAAAMSRDPDTANRLLDESVSDSVLGPDFPVLQASMSVDDLGASRLITSLTVGLAQARSYSQLSSGGVADSISAPAYNQFLEGLLDLPGGFPVAAELLRMRLHTFKGVNIDPDQGTIKLGRDLLARLDLSERHEGFCYHHLNEIALVCLSGADAYSSAVELCATLASALADYRSDGWQYGELTGTLFQLQPRAALEAFLGRNEKIGYRAPLRAFDGEFSPINRASPAALLSWANQDAPDRYPKLAREICLVQKAGDSPELTWAPLALCLLENAPDRAGVLEAFSKGLQPTVWSGSLADVLTPYLALARRLGSHSDPLVVSWSHSQESRLARLIEVEQKNERVIDESFE